MNTPDLPKTPLTPLARAIKATGSMAALAKVLGVTKAAVHQWQHPGRRIPAQHCPAIERLTAGDVRCEDLRPDVDWSILRGSKKRGGK